MSHVKLMRSNCLNGSVVLAERQVSGDPEYVVLTQGDTCDLSLVDPPHITCITPDLTLARQQFNESVYQLNIDQGIEDTDKFVEEY